MRRWVVVACMLGSGLALAQEAPHSAAVDALKQADVEFCEASAAHGLAGWLAHFDEDAVIFPATGPVVRGLPAIKAYYAKTGFTPAGLRWTPVGAAVAASGELGYTYGTWEWTGKGADGKPIVQRGKYTTVWRKQADGAWKVALDIGNVEPAAPPVAP
jgi:ketosteroid isomerase-like protein